MSAEFYRAMLKCLIGIFMTFVRIVSASGVSRYNPRKSHIESEMDS